MDDIHIFRCAGWVDKLFKLAPLSKDFWWKIPVLLQASLLIRHVLSWSDEVSQANDLDCPVTRAVHGDFVFQKKWRHPQNFDLNLVGRQDVPNCMSYCGILSVSIWQQHRHRLFKMSCSVFCEKVHLWPHWYRATKWTETIRAKVWVLCQHVDCSWFLIQVNCFHIC